MRPKYVAGNSNSIQEYALGNDKNRSNYPALAVVYAPLRHTIIILTIDNIAFSVLHN